MRGTSSVTGRARRRLQQALQHVLVLALTMLLVALCMVAFPDLMPVSVRDRLGLAPVQQVLTSGGGSYRFMRVQSGDPDVPVAYSRCRTLRFVVNPDGAPAAFADAAFIQDAVRRVSAASGLRFEYAGTTRQTRTSRGYAQGPILFDFADQADLPALDGNAAIGGSARRVIRGREYYTSGVVTFERGYLAMLSTRTGGGERATAIAVHEIGHVLGLGHVSDPDEIMTPDGDGPLDLGPGDRTGLRILGAGPC